MAVFLSWTGCERENIVSFTVSLMSCSRYNLLYINYLILFLNVFLHIIDSAAKDRSGQVAQLPKASSPLIL